jgi:hypothetical protein
MPTRTPSEWATLIDDLSRNGVRVPPVILLDGDKPFLFDGASRLDAIERVGAAVAFKNGVSRSSRQPARLRPSRLRSSS